MYLLIKGNTGIHNHDPTIGIDLSPSVDACVYERMKKHPGAATLWVSSKPRSKKGFDMNSLDEIHSLNEKNAALLRMMASHIRANGSDTKCSDLLHGCQIGERINSELGKCLDDATTLATT